MEIGGLPIVRLEAARGDPEAPAFVNADILPGRGMMLLQARAYLPGHGEFDVLESPTAEQAARQMDGCAEDFSGNRSFAFGAAILAPFANRVCGAPAPDRQIVADLGGVTKILPANWSGKAHGSQAYAMHGLMLAAQVTDWRQVSAGRLEGRWLAANFGGRWPSQSEIQFAWTLTARTLELDLTFINVGDEIAPLGVGWHPYFALPSRDRRQARLHIPALQRLEVGDYDAVLPTGRILPAVGPYDFTTPGGAALGDIHLDDCFVGLMRNELSGTVDIELVDPLANYGVRLRTPSPGVKAVQAYSPRNEAFVVLEPQFNWIDPFGPAWEPELDTGMVQLRPGEACSYRVTTELFVPHG